MTKEIPLTKGNVALVDDDDFEWLSEWKWYAHGKDGHAYAIRSSWGGKAIIMHREVMNCPAGMVVDHINHNPFDNRRSNLRICSQRQNMQNKRKHTGAHSYKGVTKHKTRWRAMIQVSGKLTILGHFASQIEGAVAYDAAATGLFGEFAHLNFSAERDWIIPVGPPVAWPPPPALATRMLAV